ncbi:MAG: chromosomal replication initiator protein DnaA [Lachnospiraceae bacterium]|nr:chromosomal replication initiator protein DnaA [Lachnospiraceae bacterium]
MKEEIEKRWDEILNYLETENGISRILIDTWIRPLKISKVKDKDIYFIMEETFGQRGIQFLQNKMYDLDLCSAIQVLFNLTDFYTIHITLEGEEDDNPSSTDSNVYDQLVEASNLNPDYTFDTFVIGDNNKHAHAVCTAVASAPGKDFNPLFLYGGPGLGKTHLIQSIAHYILKNDPTKKVLYVSSTTFTNEIIEAIRKQKTEEFRQRYQNIDVLLIDDIQFIINKESTQQEFFHIFNILYESKKQLIITSDRPPKELKKLDERYISRFEWGGPIDIHAPEYETRMAILTSKAERDNIKNIPVEVFEYIATNIVSNIRELEGALKKISFYSRLGNQKITVELAQDILKDLVSNEMSGTITPELIIRTVAEHKGITYEDIISSKRNQEIAEARQISMYLCRKLTDLSQQAVGNCFGGRDHSTVINSEKKVKDKISTSPAFAKDIDVITKKINPN